MPSRKLKRVHWKKDPAPGPSPRGLRSTGLEAKPQENLAQRDNPPPRPRIPELTDGDTDSGCRWSLCSGQAPRCLRPRARAPPAGPPAVCPSQGLHLRPRSSSCTSDTHGPPPRPHSLSRPVARTAGVMAGAPRGPRPSCSLTWGVDGVNTDPDALEMISSGSDPGPGRAEG